MFDIVNNFDFSVLDAIYSGLRSQWLDPVMAGLSYFASNGIGWFILSLLLLIPRKTRIAGAIALSAMLIGVVSGEIIAKNLICRIRPYHIYEEFHGEAMPFVLNAGAEKGYSFPSGHTTCSFACAVAYFKINRKVGVVTLIIASLIGFSRLYNYVHFPTDVFAGVLWGIASGLLALWIFKKFSLERKMGDNYGKT